MTKYFQVEFFQYKSVNCLMIPELFKKESKLNVSRWEIISAIKIVP